MAHFASVDRCAFSKAKDCFDYCSQRIRLQQGFAAGETGSEVSLHGSNLKPPMSALWHKQTQQRSKLQCLLAVKINPCECRATLTWRAVIPISASRPGRGIHRSSLRPTPCMLRGDAIRVRGRSGHHRAEMGACCPTFSILCAVFWPVSGLSVVRRLIGT